MWTSGLQDSSWTTIPEEVGRPIGEVCEIIIWLKD